MKSYNEGVLQNIINALKKCYIKGHQVKCNLLFFWMNLKSAMW